MADNYIHYSFEVDNLTKEELDWWLKDLEEKESGYTQYEIIRNHKIFLYSDGYADLEFVVGSLQKFIQTFRPNEVIGFEYAYTCSKPRPESFGGGVFVVSKDKITQQDTNDILEEIKKEMYENLL